MVANSTGVSARIGQLDLMGIISHDSYFSFNCVTEKYPLLWADYSQQIRKQYILKYTDPLIHTWSSTYHENLTHP